MKTSKAKLKKIMKDAQMEEKKGKSKSMAMKLAWKKEK
jgi:type II secretory pathway component PulC